MADRLAAIRKLLSHERQDRRCAAAIVLAELHINDQRSIAALTQALSDEDPLVRLYSLEALGQAHTVTAIDKIVDMMDDPDPQVRKAAESALIQLGEDAVPALQELLGGSAAVRRKAASLLSRLQSASGIESLIDTVDGVDTTVLERTRQAVRSRAAELALQEQRALRKRIEQRLNDARRTNDHGLAAALLQLLGDMADDTAVTRIMQELGPDTPLVVRRVAIGAMLIALPLSSGRRREAAIERLLDCLSEEDEEGVIRPSLMVLKDVEIPERLLPKLEGLVEAPSAAARAYVLTRLGRLGSPDSVDTLVDQLAKGAAPVRAAAREALAKIPAAAVPLARLLPQVTDALRQREIGDLLRQHKEALPEEEARRLCDVVFDQIEEGTPGARALIDTISRALPEPLMSEARRRAIQLREEGSLDRAYHLLAAIKECSAFGKEELYLMALLGLMSAPRSKRPPKVNDRVCTPFATLLREGFPLDTRLHDERSVSSDDLFYIGFAFIESRDEDERDFGRDLLEEVVARDPKDKMGIRASNKLKLARR
jgi:HEAT repeat protein